MYVCMYVCMYDSEQVIYPDQTFGAGYHSYGAIAVTGESTALSPLPLVFSYNSEKSLW